MTAAIKPSYRRTEAKYKGGAHEMYVTYDLEQRTRGDKTAVYPKVKRVYIAGEVRDWEVGDFQKKTGRRVHGVRIEYEQHRSGYRRTGFDAQRGGTGYRVEPASVSPAAQSFVQVVELPERARNPHFYPAHAALPERYRGALQRVR
jgi:hypothetical protein